MNAFATAIPSNLAVPVAAASPDAVTPVATDITASIFPELMDLAAALPDATQPVPKPATTETSDAAVAALLAMFAAPTVPVPPTMPQLQAQPQPTPPTQAIPTAIPVAATVVAPPVPDAAPPAPCSGNVPAENLFSAPAVEAEKDSAAPVVAVPVAAKPAENTPKSPVPVRGTPPALQSAPMKNEVTTKEAATPAVETKPQSPVVTPERIDVAVRASEAVAVTEVRPSRKEVAPAPTTKSVMLVAEGLSSTEAKPAAPAEAPVAPQAVRAVSVTGLVERILDRVVSFKQLGASVVRVTVKPDAQTELALRLTMDQNEGHVEAHLTRGDLSGLREQWSQLQQTLSQQGVQLSRLDPTPSTSLPEPASWTMTAFDDRQPSRRNAEPEAEMAETTGTPTQTATATQRRATTQKGWEGWA